MRLAMVVVGVGLSWIAAGWGSSPRCAPSGCAGVKGVVKHCGDRHTGSCSPQPVASVTLLDSRARLVSRIFPAPGHLLNERFFFGALVPGHYILETTVAGVLVKRTVAIPAGRTIHTNIVIPIK
jgi:hypothetical protein